MLVENILAEIGVDMSVFPSAGHLASLGRPVPGQRPVRLQAPLRSHPQRDLPSERIPVRRMADPDEMGRLGAVSRLRSASLGSQCRRRRGMLLR